MYVWARLPEPWAEDSVKFCTQLAQSTGVADLVPGSGNQEEGYVRFALVESPAILEAAVRKIAEFQKESDLTLKRAGAAIVQQSIRVRPSNAGQGASLRSKQLTFAAAIALTFDMGIYFRRASRLPVRCAQQLLLLVQPVYGNTYTSSIRNFTLLIIVSTRRQLFLPRKLGLKPLLQWPVLIST